MSWRERALLMVAFVSLAAGLDRRNVPGTSYIDWKFGDKQEETTTTTTSTLSEAPDKIDPDRFGVPETAHIDQVKDVVATDFSTTESDEATTILSPAGPLVRGPGTIEKIDVDRTGVPGTSFIDREKDTVSPDSNTMQGESSITAMTPTNPPANKTHGTIENIDIDRTGVPGTSYIDREKDSENPDSITKKTTTTMTPTAPPVKAHGTIEKIDVDRTGVPGTSYIDREKGTVNPDSNTTADIVFPVVSDHDNASVNKEHHVDKEPSLLVSKADEPHLNKKKHGSTVSKKKLTSSKTEEMRKEEKGGKVNISKSKRSITETNKRKTKKSNSELFNHLGLRKLKMPAVNHHRKRLASQSRKAHRHTSSADSKMFVIKLPPEPYYYAHHDQNEVKKKPVNTLPVSFSSNGKPSRVYHWNIPVMKKMVARKAGSPKAALFADSDVFNIDKQATWNDSGDEKPYHTKTAFYAPQKTSKEAFRKYFSGNGKPHSFYVMSKSRTPISTYRLLP